MTGNNLFAYGTLMCEDIMHEVAGELFERVPGTISGFSRYRVRGETYPGLVPQEGGSVDGVLYLNITRSAWERLDRFEGAMYETVTLPVVCNGKIIAAESYIVKPAFRHLLENTLWDFSLFLESGKTLFRNGYQGFFRYQN